MQNKKIYIHKAITRSSPVVAHVIINIKQFPFAAVYLTVLGVRGRQWF